MKSSGQCLAAHYTKSQFHSMCLSVFLSSLETTIISTSLVTIVNDLKGYSQGSWIITSYLLTYTGGRTFLRTRDTHRIDSNTPVRVPDHLGQNQRCFGPQVLLDDNHWHFYRSLGRMWGGSDDHAAVSQYMMPIENRSEELCSRIIGLCFEHFKGLVRLTPLKFV